MVAHRTWIQLDRVALISNLANISKLVGERTKISPVVKANAYGHGISQVVSVLRRSDFWAFSVASGDEALMLRQLTPRKILVLSSWVPAELPSLIKQGIEFVVWSRAAIRQAATVASRLGIRARVHLKIDTGTSRIGIRPEYVNEALAELQNRPSLLLSGVFTHYANAEAASATLTQQQTALYLKAVEQIPTRVLRHAACTAAAVRFPETRLDAVRLGIGLYGIWPSPETKKALGTRLSLKPVLTWQTRLLQLKWIPRKSAVGYGASVRVGQRTLLGIVPVGYSDGLDRSLSNTGSLSVRGQRAAILGRVCMNLTMIDCTKIPDVRSGDRVTLIGENVTAEDHAQWAKTISYEIVARLSPFIPRLLSRA